jgi:purine-binding chemotaxis protein CheW
MVTRQRHDPSKTLVGFMVGDVTYAVSIFTVREICHPLPVVALPRSPHAVRGVADFRGEVVAVVDLRERFGLPPNDGARAKWIVCDVDVETAGLRPPQRHSERPGRFVALVVDAVTEVFGTQGQELRPAPDLGGGEGARGILGVTQKTNRMVFVLDTRAFRAISEEVMRDHSDDIGTFQ